MFGSLKNILTSGWLENEDNYTVLVSMEYENSLWQVFSVYRIPTTNDYIRVEFESDRILTLSTCYNNSEKVVLHAKLIKRIKK